MKILILAGGFWLGCKLYPYHKPPRRIQMCIIHSVIITRMVREKSLGLRICTTLLLLAVYIFIMWHNRRTLYRKGVKLNTYCSLQFHDRSAVIRSSNGDISKLFIVTISQPLVVWRLPLWPGSTEDSPYDYQLTLCCPDILVGWDSCQVSGQIELPNLDIVLSKPLLIKFCLYVWVNSKETLWSQRGSKV